MTTGSHEPPGGGWPGPEMPEVRSAGLVEASGAAVPRAPRRRRLWWLISVVVVAVIAAAVAYRVGGDNALRDYKTQVAASASAEQAKLPPADLFCPDPNSEDARKAIRDLPVVVIDEPPAERVVVMRKGVVVVVKADLAGDLVVCGNDARLALEKTPRPSARILMQGGTDTKSKGAGPMVFMVNSVTVDPARVWFTNRNPQIVACASAAGKSRPCSSYYATQLPPTPTPSRSR